MAPYTPIDLVRQCQHTVRVIDAGAESHQSAFELSTDTSHSPRSFERPMFTRRVCQEEVELETVVLVHFHLKNATSNRLCRKACDDIGRTHRLKAPIEGRVTVPSDHTIGQRHDATVRKREGKYKNPL